MANDEKWMTGPTRAQRDEAARLGLTVPPRTTGSQLAKLIKQAQDNTPPNSEQLATAARFDVTVTDGMTYGQLKRRLTPIARQHAVEAMRANLALRAGTVIRFEGMSYEITFIGGVDGRYFARLKLLTHRQWNYAEREVPIYRIETVKAVKRTAAMATVGSAA